MSSSPVAAIDIGTNSTNLLVVGADGADLTRVVRVTRLGQDVDRTRALAAEAIDRTLTQLEEYAATIRDLGAGAVRAVATSACRDATNRDEFLDRAAEVLGVRPIVISGDEEGRLTFHGATVGLPSASPPHLLVDIGGGSTELMWGDGTSLVGGSVDVGSVRATESHLHTDPPRPEELTNAIGEVRDEIEELLRAQPALLQPATLVGTAGTITTIAAVELGLLGDDWSPIHGLVLRRDAIEEVFRALATMPLADRRHEPGLPPARADVIVGGCCVLLGIMRHLQAPSMVVSLHNLLDGVAAELLAGGR